MSRTLQTAYHLGHAHGVRDSGLAERISAAMYSYLREDLGYSEASARERTRAELERLIPKAVVSALALADIHLQGRTVVDLGGGLGGLSVELAESGANVICIEPGAAWRDIAAARLRASGRGIAIGAMGEALPLKTDSVDVVVSLRVLEHVSDPDRVISETFRILKPGGIFYFSCENYLAFREQHYKIAWLPLLPKVLGSAYLRIRGRSPKFLNESVTYVTRPGIIRSLKRTGYELRREGALHRKVLSASSLTKQFMPMLVRFVPEHLRRQLITAIVIARGFFSVGITEICCKPEHSQDLS